MSLRGFFSRKTDSQRRRKTATALSAFAAQAEFLEDRVLLSVESPLLTDHGVTFENTNVIGPQVQFFSVNNPLYSNNNGATFGRGNGSGLFVNLDGTQPFGRPNAPQVPVVQSITYSSSGGSLIFSNNANTGSSIHLKNMTLDTLVIDGSQFTGNGRAGLIIDLVNAQIGSIVIINSTFANNANDGLCILGDNSVVDSIQLINNVITNNSAAPLVQNDGAFIQFKNSRLGELVVSGNQFTANGANGLRVDLDNTSLGGLSLTNNVANGNARNGNFSGVFLDFQDSDVRGNVLTNTFSNNNQGDGLRILTSRSILPNGTTATGLRNLNLDTIRGNTFNNNGGVGLSVDLRQNTTFGANITANVITNNGRAGLSLVAKDTVDAFDVTIGGTTVDPQNNNLDSNLIDANRGAGIAIALDDTSSVIGNTTGRFQILNNMISNTVDDNLFTTQFAGEGIFVRARGSIALVNGAARILNSTIDGNVIAGNQSHGMSFDISEDSEVVGLLIGDVFNPNDPKENFEGDGFFFQNQFTRNSGNLVLNNGGDGLNFLRRDSAVAQDVQIIDNLFDGNNSGINYTVRNLNNVVNTVTIQHNDTTNNRVSGMVIATQIDAFLIAKLDNNFVSGNQGDGILTLGFEGDATDAETLGGVWTRNIVQNNVGIGMNINGVVGVLSPLTIGLMGTDSRGRSLGNLVDSNGDDGVEINAPGFIALQNNTITFNGQNNGTLNVHGDGKGIDINLNDVGLPFNTTGLLNAYLGFNVIQSNFGDGLEIISRSDESLGSITRVEVLAYGNIIDLNLGRGVDVLNAGRSETYLVFGDGTTGDGSNRNIIRSNGLEGFYTVNTSSVNQRQDVDATLAMVADTNLSGGQRARSPNLTFDINGNEIQQNGLPSNNVGQLNGSGLVVRVGTTGSIGTAEFAAAQIADRDGYGFNVDIVGVGESNSTPLFSNGRVNARVNNNTFGGNRGVDVITESFVSTLDPPTTTGNWAIGANPPYNITGQSYRTDPLARLNFEFTNNTGNSVDLVRLGAFYNNAEPDYKSRTNKTGNQAPTSGPFGNSAGRFRNAQRLPDRPSSFDSPTTSVGGLYSGFGSGVAGSISTITPGGPTSPILVSTAARAGTVQGATNASPIVITSFGHGLATGEFVEITGVQGNTAANGIFSVIVIDQDTFSLQDPITLANTTGNGNYLGGGSWSVVAQGTINNLSGAGVSPIVITDFFHGLNTGDQVTVIGVQGNTAANGTFTITVIDQFRFSLNGTAGNGNWVFGTGTYFTPSGGHGLSTGDTVAIQAFSFNNTTPGFEVDGIYNITVISPSEFLLNGTEGETNVPTLFFGGTYQQVTNPLALMYPGVGASTFRIIESGNNFANGNDFTTGSEFEIFYAGGGVGHLGYTFDREVAGTFNFRTISTRDATVTEGGQAEFVITLSEPLTTDLFVTYHTEYAGSASDGNGIASTIAADYTADSNTVVIPAGSTQVSVFIDTLADTTFEGDETFKFFIDFAFTTLVDPLTGSSFTDVFALPIDPFAIGTILDDDALPIISISDAAGFEKGDGSVGQMTFTVTLSNASSAPVFVDFSTADFTANVNVDYRANDGTLTFAPGETTKTIIIEILPDAPGAPNNDQAQETLFINLTSPKGARTDVGDFQGVGTIFEPRFVNIFDAFANGDGNAPATSQARFTVTLTDANGNPAPVPSGQTITINFNTQNGTATVANGDYVPVTNGTLVFNEFEDTRTLFVTVNQDRVFEGDERFQVTITSPQGTVQDGSAVGNILENLEVVATRNASGQAVVEVYDLRTNTIRFSFNPYPGFPGEVRVATADFNQDGIADIVTAPGPGGGPHIRVINGANGAPLADFFAYDPGFGGGVFVATGDINGDGRDDIITGPDQGGGPHIRVFDVNVGFQSATVTIIENFLAGDVLGPNFSGGVRVASGNVDGDLLGRDDIILGFGPGSRPLVEIYTADGIVATLPNLFRQFDAYDPAFQGGVYVSAADIGGGVGNIPDGFADIITGAGAGGGPHVKVFSGSDLAVLESFFAYSPQFFGGVRVASGDAANDPNGITSRDRISEIITAPGPGGGPHVRAFSVDGNAATTPPSVLNQFAFPSNFTAGVYISGRNRNQVGEGSPLLLDSSALSDLGTAPELTYAELAPVVEAAFNRLSAAGVDSSALDQLRRIQFVISDLSGTTLGLQSAGRILIDRTAAGRGYFVDLTPGLDEEFSHQSGRLIASDASAPDRVDLLTVILHELEHALGEEHVATLGGSHLLAPTILPGERRLPEHDLVFSSGDIFESLLDLN